MTNPKKVMLNVYFLDFKIKNILILGIVLSVNFMLSTSIFAQGVVAGTEVSNIAVVNYMIAGNAQEPIESSPTGNTLPSIGNGTATIFKVDRKVDLLITGNNNATPTPGDIQSEVTFTLLNEGNDIQTFQLTPNGTIASDIFDTSSCTTTVTSVSGSPLAGVILPTTGNIKLAQDQVANISVKCDIPPFNGGSPLIAGDTSIVSLTANVTNNGDGSTTSETVTPNNKLTVDTIYADAAGTDDSIQDAKHSARRTYTVSSSSTPPNLNIDKTILGVLDPSGGNTAITGSEVSYKIKIITTGVGTIDNIVITDITPLEMSYKPTSILLDGISISDSADADQGNFGVTTANTVTVNLGTVTAGNQHEIQITYIIN